VIDGLFIVSVYTTKGCTNRSSSVEVLGNSGTHTTKNGYTERDSDKLLGGLA